MTPPLLNKPDADPDALSATGDLFTDKDLPDYQKNGWPFYVWAASILYGTLITIVFPPGFGAFLLLGSGFLLVFIWMGFLALCGLPSLAILIACFRILTQRKVSPPLLKSICAGVLFISACISFYIFNIHAVRIIAAFGAGIALATGTIRLFKKRHTLIDESNRRSS